MSPNTTGPAPAAAPPRSADAPDDPSIGRPASSDSTRLTQPASGATPAVDVPDTSNGAARRRPATPSGSKSKASKHKPPRRRRRARRVHRVVRHIELWSVFKLATVFFACAYAIVLIAGYILWRAADQAGTIEGLEGFFETSGGYTEYAVDGSVVFKAAASGGVVLAIGGVVFSLIGALLFNLISDLTGGIRMTVIDEDLIVTGSGRRSSKAAPGPGNRPPTRDQDAAAKP